MLQKPKGTKDLYGKEINTKDFIIGILEYVSGLYNIEKIETPIFEAVETFTKSVGETSDIVSKEMFEFTDKGDRQMVLRPEGTAGVIRAFIENKLYGLNKSRFYYIGPMFRYENPQKGRQRQFNQYGVEIISQKNILIDTEVIMLASFIFKSLGLKAKLLINSLGDKESRDAYSKAVREYLYNYKDQLTQDSLNRLEKNPLRILDDKIDGKKDFIKNAPKFKDFYTKESKEYFDEIKENLSAYEIDFEVDEKLVRGLDYYTDIVFEFVSVSGEAGSQSTLLAGGRYDNLVKQMGGPELSGIGFATGIERLMIEIEKTIPEDAIDTTPAAFVCAISEITEKPSLEIANLLRSAGISSEWLPRSYKIQKALEKYESSGCNVAVLIGEKELAVGNVIVRVGKKQEEIKISELIEYISEIEE